MSKEYILTISEGEKTEKQIINNIQRNFFNNSNKELIILSFKTNIYALWNTMKDDCFETDIIEVLIERDPSINEIFKNIDKNAISEKYLFFDYDGHAYKEEEVDNIISEMIDVFNNETEHGKIYISYPMVEAIKDLKRIDTCTRRCSVPAKENIKYKNLVAIDTDFSNLIELMLYEWYFILGFCLKKANCIVSSSFNIPSYNNYKDKINQSSIFENQFKKFIEKNQLIAVLGGIPFFIIDYFGENLYNIIFSCNSVLCNKGDCKS